MLSGSATPRPELGSWGEQVAGWFLMHHGLEVTGTNVIVDGGEIDILARDHEDKVAVEVRTRRGDLDDVIAVDRSKLGRMRRNARAARANRVDLVVVIVTDAGIRLQWSPDL